MNPTCPVISDFAPHCICNHFAELPSKTRIYLTKCTNLMILLLLKHINPADLHNPTMISQ